MKKKILIATGIYPPDIGGPARMVGALNDALEAKGYSVKILTYSEKKSNPREKRSGVYRIVRSGLWGRWMYFWKFLRLVKWCDVIYSTDTYSAGYFSFLAKKFWGKKYILRFAGDSAWETAFLRGWTSDYILDFESKKYSSRVEWLKERRRKILKNADKIIAVSNFMAGLAEKIGAEREKIEVVYNSVDFTEFAVEDYLIDDIQERYKLFGYKIIMTAGRLVPWKGIDGLMQSFEEILKSDGIPPTKLLIVGDGPDRKRLEKIRQKSPARDRIIFSGKVPLNKIFSFYHLADVFVLNSLYEGLSHVLLEVLRQGIPVVASNCGGNPEVIKDSKNGLLVEYNDKRGISDAIRRVLTGSRWQTKEYQEACRQSLKKFDWEKNINATLGIIERL